MIYIICFLICALPFIVYLTTNLLDTLDKDAVDGARIAFITGLIPYVNILLAFFMVVFLVASCVYDLQGKLLRKKKKGLE